MELFFPPSASARCSVRKTAIVALDAQYAWGGSLYLAIQYAYPYFFSWSLTHDKSHHVMKLECPGGTELEPQATPKPTPCHEVQPRFQIMFKPWIPPPTGSHLRYKIFSYALCLLKSLRIIKSRSTIWNPTPRTMTRAGETK